jgi:hypothetical protein
VVDDASSGSRLVAHLGEIGVGDQQKVLDKIAG